MSPVATVAGGSGFVGRAIVEALRSDGYAVRFIGRAGPDARWDDLDSVRRAVEGSDILVNLAGKSVDCRYTERNRDEILHSRIATTGMLRDAVAAASRPPALWLNASTATIYRYALDHPQTEDGGELGEGFSVDVARAWESELFEGSLPATRRVALRMAIVLGDGPATGMLFRLARWGLGGPQYDGRWFAHRRYRGIGPHPTGGPAPWHRSRGRQRFSWIHLDDAVGAVRFIRDHPDIAGAVNLASPNPVDNRTLMQTLRRAVGMPLGLAAPRFVLEPAMWALRTEPELVLKSRWVVPARLQAAGFTFGHPDLDEAVADVWRTMRR
ncbi:DUF1731 domain-containing protein [Microbacterium protaetiae]|uniref:DUF1731 domain-containing protein n=1 Tax=Microbacterium protaetiae TaxID=2509458 RepID=A0A4P6E961_9MICO|nr:DUF1731 domain-containing protein [Microbacterium protaetiae]QAY58620.1 DUF1731 domain-containing protein [Microbacterium protaetiae]